MRTYVAFLRAINLGARRKFGKDDLRACLERAGFDEVETYLNTGNVRLRWPEPHDNAEHEGGGEALAATLEAAFRADRGFEVPTVVLSPEELRQVVADGVELVTRFGAPGQHYASLLKQPPEASAVAELERLIVPGERVVVAGRACHLLLDRRDNYHKSKLGNSFIERRLGVATNRNFRVISTLADRWG